MTGIPETLDRLSVPVDSLKPYPGNPRRGNVDSIVKSLERNGQYRPIVVNKRTSEVLAGNHTLLAAKKLGWDEIAATFVDVDEDQAARIVLVDNRANDVAGYDDDELRELLESLPDLDGTGYDDDELAALIESASTTPDQLDDVEPSEPPVNPLTNNGDVWMLGDHRLICGDCRDANTVARLLDGAAVNVAFTSPPYADRRVYDEDSGFKPVPPDDYVEWFEPVQANVAQHLADDGSWFVNIKAGCENGQRQLYVHDLTLAHVRKWRWLFVDEFCWRDTRNGIPGGWNNRFKDAWEPVFHFSKSSKIKFHALANATPTQDAFDYSPNNAQAGTGSGLLGEKANGSHAGLARPSNVIEMASGGSEPNHPAQFPVNLPAWFIRAFSDTEDVVFDPFVGSGSTLLAAENTGRIAYGVEISPAYCDVIIDRWERHTGKKAELARQT